MEALEDHTKPYKVGLILIVRLNLIQGFKIEGEDQEPMILEWQAIYSEIMVKSEICKIKIGQ